MSQAYLTTEELALRIKYDARTIRERMRDSVLLQGVHFVRSSGGCGMTAENFPRKVPEATAANRAMRRLISRIAWAVEMTLPIPPWVHAKMLFRFCLFHTDSGRPPDGNNLTRRAWSPIVRIVELDRRSPHHGGRPAATSCLGAGENPGWTAQQAWQTTSRMLFPRYSRSVPNLIRNDGSAIDRLLLPRLHGQNLGTAQHAEINNAT